MYPAVGIYKFVQFLDIGCIIGCCRIYVTIICLVHVFKRTVFLKCAVLNLHGQHGINFQSKLFCVLRVVISWGAYQINIYLMHVNS